MYRRYEPSPQHRQAAPNNKNVRQGGQQRQNVQHQKPQQKPIATPPPERRKGSVITRLIPPSLYNPETGKVFGFLTAEDLFIAALIILLIDSGDDECDNTMLILALLYLLLSEHIDLGI